MLLISERTATEGAIRQAAVFIEAALSKRSVRHG
ncbi:hypothetical protein FHS42_003176 [Streptomyces zagrosensis]|uniref:Uncharacterized protein n=1 Tax=Streptomyces zagrosensis TaxID=1042984 RepID=A0A7W9Q9F7_9ACTN|nr:hypothetical protein [Streptomyces zagrosensis]